MKKKIIVILRIILPLLLLPISRCSSGEPEVRIQSTVTGSQMHIHRTDISYRLLQSGIRRYNLLPENGHTHTFEITEEQQALLELDYPIEIGSTENEYHSHLVSLQKQQF